MRLTKPWHGSGVRAGGHGGRHAAWRRYGVQQHGTLLRTALCVGAACRVLQTAISQQAVGNYVFDAQAIPFLTTATTPPASSGLTFIQVRFPTQETCCCACAARR